MELNKLINNPTTSLFDLLIYKYSKQGYSPQLVISKIDKLLFDSLGEDEKQELLQITDKPTIYQNIIKYITPYQEIAELIYNYSKTLAELVEICVKTSKSQNNEIEPNEAIDLIMNDPPQYIIDHPKYKLLLELFQNEMMDIINLPEISQGYLLNESFNTTLLEDAFYLCLSNLNDNIITDPKLRTALKHYGFVDYSEKNTLIIDLNNLYKSHYSI